MLRSLTYMQPVYENGYCSYGMVKREMQAAVSPFPCLKTEERGENMWRCDYSPGYLWMGGFPGGIARILIWLVIILLIVLLCMQLLAFVKSRTAQSRDRYDSLGILKTRYAKGEVSEDEYSRMKEILFKR